jgi:hypothetical protein
MTGFSHLKKFPFLAMAAILDSGWGYNFERGSPNNQELP